MNEKTAKVVHDISASDASHSKSVENQLKETLEQLNLALEVSNAGTWDWDIVSNTFHWSPHFLKVFGLAPGIEAGFDVWTRIVHPDDRESAAARIKESIDLRIDLLNEYRIVVNGEIRWIEAVGKTFYDGDTPVRMIGLCTDISRRKRIEKEVLLSRELLSDTEKNGKVGGWRFDVATGQRTWTDETFRILEMDKKEGIPDMAKGIDFVLPPYRAMAIEGIRRAISFGEPYDQEWEVLTAKGNRKWVHSVGRAHQQNGKTIYVTGSFQDITDRKTAEEKLRQNEQALREAQRVAQIGSWHYDFPTKTLTWSEELYKLYQFDPSLPPKDSEADQKNYTPESAARLILALQETFQTGIPYVVDLERCMPDGSHRWFQARGEMVKDKNGVMVGLRGTALDITERKQIEEQLRESQNRLEMATSSAKMGIWEWNIVENYGVWDDQMCRLYDVPTGEGALSFEVWQSLIHPEDREAAWEKSMGATHAERPFDTEFRICRSDGTVRFIKANGIVIRDESGKAVKMIGVNHDITERREAEESLRNHLFQLNLILSNTPIILSAINAAGEYILVEGKGLALVKRVAGTAPHRNIHEIYHDRPDILGYIKRALSGESVQVTFEMEGQILDVTYEPIRESSGKIQGVVSLAQVVTEKTRMAEELQKSQKLESLGILAGGIAHDFNNLMGGIFGYVDIAKDQSTNEHVNRYLSKAMNTIDRARALTRQLLTFAKGGVPVRESGNLFPFIRETTEFALSGSNVAPVFDIEESLWLCHFDKNQIGQVIDNIVINAKQAMPVGGTLKVAARNILIDEKGHPLLKAGRYICISITDTGIGIPRELLGRIFDPFFTTKSTGHGLGLATCYSIVKHHDGCIDVESEPGKGSTFRVYLPASSSSAASASKTATATYRGQGTMIVMDDEEVIRETISAILTSLGFTVVVKVNGRDAVDFFRSELAAGRTIAGLLFDLTVPGGMGGIEAVLEIRKIDPRVPVFVASGYADDPVMKNPAEFGFTGSVCKPFQKSDLVELFSTHLPNRM